MHSWLWADSCIAGPAVEDAAVGVPDEDPDLHGELPGHASLNIGNLYCIIQF